MKANEFSKCLLCGKGMVQAGAPVFLRVQIEYHLLNLPAIQRAAGLEMALGPLASVMGPDESLATEMSKGTGLICASCMIEMQPPFAILEAATREKEDEAQDG